MDMGLKKTQKNYFVPVCQHRIKIIKGNTAESGKTKNLLAKICFNLTFSYYDVMGQAFALVTIFTYIASSLTPKNK